MSRDKKILLNTAICAGIALFATESSAQAQTTSVTLYGVMDTGIEYISHAGPGGSGGSARVTSGNSAGSRWGVRGKEDLGGGNHAMFVLEGGVSADTGVAAQGGRLFGRQAFVGLGGNWGELTFGRQMNTLFQFFYPYDPMHYFTYGLSAQDMTFVARSDNAVKYTYKLSGLTMTAMYSTGYDAVAGQGEVPGNYRVGQQMSTGANYTNGNFSAAIVYDQRRGTTVATQSLVERRYAAGVAYDLGRASVSAGYRFLTSDTTTGVTRANLYWAGGNYNITPTLNLQGGVFRNDVNHSSDASTSIALALIYSVSKRTSLFTNIGYVINEGKAKNSVVIQGTGYAGVNQTGIVAGIKHIL